MRIILKPFLVASLLLLALAAATVAQAAWRLPDVSTAEPKPALVLLTAQGEPFARRGEYREPPVNVAALPRHVVAPVLAIEDRRFYEHGAVDLRGMTRAALVNLRAGEARQGGSTITQQLAKITVTGAERTFTRKLQEAVVAARLERELGKDEILSRYLSSVYYGDGVYGLRAAARHYFDKDPEDLSLAEAAMLAGVINKPSRLAPTRDLAAAQARGRLVLAAMVDAGWLTPAEAAATPPAVPRPGRPTLPVGRHFADWVSPTVKADLGTGHGEVAVRTTLDGSLQALAERAVRTALEKQGARGGPKEAALVAMRPTGEVVAMVGGRDYADSQFNRAVQARRQPGSAFKPFVYLAAVRQGATPETLVDDRPITVGGWTPKNSGGGHRGTMTFREAFATSNNVAAVRIAESVGRDAVVLAARDLGVASDLRDVPSMALGTSGVTLLELTSAYAGVAAGTYPVSAFGVPQSEGRSGPVAQGTPLDAFAEQAPMLTLLRSVVDEGTGRAAALPIPAYGKTGTSQNNRDAWFVGFAGDLVVGVWVGNDDESPMTGVTGGGLPARIWRDFMRTALAPEIEAAQAQAQVPNRSGWEIPPPPDHDAPLRRPPEWVGRLEDSLGSGAWY